MEKCPFPPLDRSSPKFSIVEELIRSVDSIHLFVVVVNTGVPVYGLFLVVEFPSVDDLCIVDGCQYVDLFPIHELDVVHRRVVHDTNIAFILDYFLLLH